MFEFLHTFHPSPILLTAGNLTIRWYGLALAAGTIVAYVVALRLARKAGLSEERFATLFTATVLIGFLGARFYHVLNEPYYYWHHPSEILAVWRGGLAIHGGIIAGALTIWHFCKRWSISFWKIADTIVPALAIGQAIGRFGNFFNQELFGKPTGLPWGIPIDAELRPQGFERFTYFHPTFLYEFLWDAGTFAILMILHRRNSAHQGVITAVYLMLYAAGRALTEFLRIDDVPIIFGVRLPLLVSILLGLLGLALLWYATRKTQKKAAQ
jgi:phosphatidylglycerol:prolipoprotein diacylglycerol transferase